MLAKTNTEGAKAKAPLGSRVTRAAKLHAWPPRDRGTQGCPPRSAMPQLARGSPEQIRAEEVAVLGEAVVLDHVRGWLSHGDTEGTGQQRWHRWLGSGGREGTPGPDVPPWTHPLRSMTCHSEAPPQCGLLEWCKRRAPSLVLGMALSFLYLGTPPPLCLSCPL